MHEESIFAAALEKRLPAQRAAYLDDACACDQDLRRRVEALLRAHDQSGDLLDAPTSGATPSSIETLDSAFAAAGQIPARPSAEAPGTRVPEPSQIADDRSGARDDPPGCTSGPTA
jgi:hypothetical protein